MISRGEKQPVFHMASPTGRIDDPNVFSVFRGWHHLFFSIIPTVRGGGLCIGFAVQAGI